MSDTKPISMYSRPTCPWDAPVRKTLDGLNIDYVYVDIRENDEAKATIRGINAGNETVPTLIFPDGSALAEPNPHQLHQKLHALGYDVPMMRMWQAYIMGMFGSPIGWILLLLLVMLIRALF